MRNVASDCWIDLFKRRPFVFLTGDLGFNALESLRNAMGNYFLNAGVAEQNMVSVAAGLSSQGMDVWVYSIAPFCYARPFEQIRNDICFNKFPVKLVGNGGGYGYGAMGESHHALEDYGALLSLPDMHVYVPAFSVDLPVLIDHLSQVDHPAYLRLGLCEKPGSVDVPMFAPWRKLTDGSGPALVFIGPLVGGILNIINDYPKAERPELWVVSELPIDVESIPSNFLDKIEREQRLCVVEEHVQQGGLGQAIAYSLLRLGVKILDFRHLYALGYPSGTRGSQSFHRKECGLDAQSVLKTIDHMGI